MRRSVWALVVAVPVVALLASGFGRGPNAVRSPIVGHPAPAFKLDALDGTSLTLASLRGRPVVVNFWASWCTTCPADHSQILRAWHTFRARGVAFVGIDYQDTVSDARAFLRQHGSGWPQLRDPNQQTAIDFGVYGVPETYFIDRNGVVRYKSTGPVTWTVLQQQIGRLVR